MTHREAAASAPAQTQSTPRRSSFGGDVLRLVSGSFIAQILGFLAAPILTRLYAPEAFGLLALFTSITSILGVIACLRYEMAIVLPESERNGANVFGLSLAVNALVALTLVPLLWFGGDALVVWLNAPALKPYLWLIPVVVMFGGLGAGHPALNYWATRTRRYQLKATVHVTGVATTDGLQLAAGFAGFVSGGSLILTSIIGSMIGPLILGWRILREDGRLFLASISLPGMVEALKRYRKFPLFSTWAALLNTASWQLPALLLASYFSSATVGYYALGFRVLQAPMSFIGASIGQVFYQRSAVARTEGTLSGLVEATFRQLVMFGLFPMLLLAAIGSELFVLLFGPQWQEAGVYAQILAPWAFVWFISSPLSTLTMVMEKQEFGLWINVLIFATRLLSLVAGGMLQNIYYALVLFSASGILVYGYLNLWLMQQAGVSWRRIVRILAPYLILSLVTALGLSLLRALGVNSWLLLAVAAVISAGYSLYVLSRLPRFNTFWRRTPFGRKPTL